MTVGFQEGTHDSVSGQGHMTSLLLICYIHKRWVFVTSIAAKPFIFFSNRCHRVQFRRWSNSTRRSCHLCTDTSLVFSAYDEYEVSPYEELKLTLVRNIEMSRMASIMAGRFSTQRSLNHIDLVKVKVQSTFLVNAKFYVICTEIAMQRTGK